MRSTPRSAPTGAKRRLPRPRSSDSGGHRHQRTGFRDAFPAGTEATLLLAVRQKLAWPCFSEAIMTEYAEVIARPKFSFSAAEISAVLALVRERGELIVPAGLPPELPDADDAKILHCAQAVGAEFIVTGDKRHFPPKDCDPIRVVNAGELLDRITLEI